MCALCTPNIGVLQGADESGFAHGKLVGAGSFIDGLKQIGQSPFFVGGGKSKYRSCGIFVTNHSLALVESSFSNKSEVDGAAVE